MTFEGQGHDAEQTKREWSELEKYVLHKKLGDDLYHKGGPSCMGMVMVMGTCAGRSERDVRKR